MSKKINVIITGGGSSGIGKYLEQGGKSAFLVDCQIPYSKEALVNYLGVEPDKYCSEDTAAMLAMKALERCEKLLPNEPKENLMGVAVTASLAKEGEREGREHKVCMSVIDYQQQDMTTFNYRGKSRLEEEQCLAEHIKELLNTLDGTEVYYGLNFEGVYEPKRNDVDLLPVYLGKSAFKYLNSQNDNKQNYEDSIILSSSFNPCHDGHLGIVKYLREKYPKKQIFAELSILNYEKPTVNYYSLHKRLDSIPLGVFDDVIISRLPLYKDKGREYSGATFAMGDDTLNRITDEELEYITLYSSRIISFPRVGVELRNIREDYIDWRDVILAKDYESRAESSREIRKNT